MELWVMNEQEAARAQDILNRRISGPEWTCACGERLGPQFTQCWKCGAYRRES